MQILIDIAENRFNRLKEGKIPHGCIAEKMILNAVKEGVPVVPPQEPMVEIDLYSVIKQKYIEREVLDKIRAELHATAEMHDDGDYYLREEWIDEYFDKYKAETEDT